MTKGKKKEDCKGVRSTKGKGKVKDKASFQKAIYEENDPIKREKIMKDFFGEE